MSDEIGHCDLLDLFACHLEWHKKRNVAHIKSFSLPWTMVIATRAFSRGSIARSKLAAA